MNYSYTVQGISTGLIKPGDELITLIISSLSKMGLTLENGDILAIAESAVATAEGNIINLQEITPSEKANDLSEKYQLDPAIAEIVLKESDDIIGGIPGFLLSIRNGHLLPNAGVDGSNAPDGHVTLLPRDPDMTARKLREEIQKITGAHIGVLIIDSRTHPMRYGCTGIALGCSGIQAVLDERGRKDLFGKELKVTRRAIADSIASAAELVMGEADEGIPMVLIRGLGIRTGEGGEGIEQISAEECLYMGSLTTHLKNSK